MKNLLKFILLLVATQSGIAQNDFPIEKEIKNLLKEGNHTFYNMQVLKRGGHENEKEYKDAVNSEINLSDYEFEKITNEPITFILDSLSKKSVQIHFKDSSVFIRSYGDQNLCYIEINFASKYVDFNKIELNFHKKIRVTSTDNIFGSGWNGFQWKGEVENIEMTIGKLNAGGKIFIKVDGIDSSGKKRRIFLLS